MDFIAIIISYSSLIVFIVSTLVYILLQKDYAFICAPRILFVVGLVFSRCLTYYAIVANLMLYFTDNDVNLVKAAVYSNLQESLSALFVIFMANSADSFVGRFRTLVFSTTAFILGLASMLMFNPHDERWLIVTMLVLLALGRAGEGLLDKVIIDLVDDQVDKSEDQNKNRSIARAEIWLNIANAFGAISATMWVAPYALQLPHTTWNRSFLICFISMTVTFLIFCKGHSVYYQGELTHRPIEIVLRVCRAHVQKLLKKLLKSNQRSNSTQEIRSPERNLQENEEITTPPIGEKDHKGDRGYDPEDEKVLRSLLRMFPLWGTFFVVSLISAVGTTFYIVQYNNLENKYHIPVQVYKVIQNFSCFQINSVYQSISFGYSDNQKVKIGVGMVCSIISCAFALLLEVQKPGDSAHAKTIISFFLLVPQFVMLGCMEGLTESGLLTFFKSQVDKSVKNYGFEYMKIVMCLGRLGNIALIVILSNQFDWFSLQDRNHGTHLHNYFQLLICVTSLNLIVYCCIAIWFYKDRRQDHIAST